jgi:hypothetical protein
VHHKSTTDVNKLDKLFANSAGTVKARKGRQSSIHEGIAAATLQPKPFYLTGTNYKISLLDLRIKLYICVEQSQPLKAADTLILCQRIRIGGLIAGAKKVLYGRRGDVIG